MNNDMKCPVCNVGYVHESVNHWCCDYEFCPSYDETDTETYDILIRTRKALEIIKKELDIRKKQVEIANKAFDFINTEWDNIDCSRKELGACAFNAKEDIAGWESGIETAEQKDKQ